MNYPWNCIFSYGYHGKSNDEPRNKKKKNK